MRALVALRRRPHHDQQRGGPGFWRKLPGQSDAHCACHGEGLLEWVPDPSVANPQQNRRVLRPQVERLRDQSRLPEKMEPIQAWQVEVSHDKVRGLANCR